MIVTSPFCAPLPGKKNNNKGENRWPLAPLVTLIYPWCIRGQWLQFSCQPTHRDTLLINIYSINISRICKCICVHKYAMSTLSTNRLAGVGEMCLANILPRDFNFISVLLCCFPSCFEFDVEWGISLVCSCMRVCIVSCWVWLLHKYANFLGFLSTAGDIHFCFLCFLLLPPPWWTFFLFLLLTGCTPSCQ